MVNNIRIKEAPQSSESPRGEVGEIDTRAPFQSVKAAVSLFGEVVSKKRPALKRSKTSTENVIDRETQLLLARREIDKVKLKLENASNTKERAQSELEKAQQTVNDLTTKLNSAVESKRLAIEATEAVKHKAKQLEQVRSQNNSGTDTWKSELNATRDEYRKAAAELDKAKQELTKIRQDFDSILDAKVAAFQQAADAQRSAKLNSEKVAELSLEIQSMQKSLEHLKATSEQAKEEQVKIVAEKDERLKKCKMAKEESEKKLIALRGDCNPDLIKALEASLAEATGQIENIQDEMENIHALNMDTVKLITAELNEATKKLQVVAEEEGLERNIVCNLRRELDDVRKERISWEEKEQKQQALLKELQAEQERAKIELADLLQRQADASEEESNTYQQLALDTEIATKEAEDAKKELEVVKREVEVIRKAAAEAEKQVEEITKEVEAARAAEAKALEQIKKKDGNPKSGTWIKLSFSEFDSFTRRVEESTNLAEMKLAATTFQMEAMNVKKEEADRRREEIMKEVEEVEKETEAALKQAEMAEAAKKAIENELISKRRQEEQSGDQDQGVVSVKP